jgi:hypothetical protein
MAQVKDLTLSGATVTNTGTGTATSPKLDSDFRNVSLTLLITKTSGTVAGSVTLQGSIDGTNWYSFTSPAAVTATDVATQVVTFQITDKIFPYYRASYTGTGTMVAVISAAKIAIGK